MYTLYLENKPAVQNLEFAEIMLIKIFGIYMLVVILRVLMSETSEK